MAIHEIDKAIVNVIETPAVVIKTALKHLCNLLHCNQIGIIIFDRDEMEVHNVEVEENDLKMKHSVRKLLKQDLDTLIIGKSGNCPLDEAIAEGIIKIDEEQIFQLKGMGSNINISLLSADKQIGLINISYKNNHKFEHEEIEIVQEIGIQIVLGVEKTRLQKLAELHSVVLEKRVLERTAQLETANKELEAFSYSVSHDLRAPLRAVDGYVRILMEDYGTYLDEEGKRICSVISRSAKQMGELIDDLLALSRIGRATIQTQRVDMVNMVKSVYYELTSEEERKNFVFQVGSLPSANVDPTLIRQVWINLIGNAIKFSSKKETINIEINAKQEEGETIYFIQDYGAGFDMQYADKLFGVFQRLHSTKEFDGTGVGLAIVQRIINRHGGRVWAEGKVNQGATFYFSLK